MKRQENSWEWAEDPFDARGWGGDMQLLLEICRDEEACQAWSITLSLLLLLTAMIIANFFHAMHLHFIPESCVFMLIGVFFAGLVYLYNLFASEVLFDIESFMSLNESTFILVLLPPIIFEGGYSLKKIYFFRNFLLIILLAVGGTAISAFMIGIPIWAASNYGGMEPQNVSGAEAMSIGSLLSATDPVAALAVYSSLGVDRTLYTLVYGESNLNDAIGIVFFRTFQNIANSQSTSTATVVWSGVVQFLEVTFLAPLLGVFTGLMAALVFKFMKFDEIPIVETIVFWAFSYLSYMMGEAPGYSGIISTLFCGFIMRHYAYHNLSDKSKLLSIDAIKSIASTADTVIFINLGLSPFAFADSSQYTNWSLPLIALTITTCMVSRALVVFLFCFLANRIRKRRRTVRPVSIKKQIVLFHAGLRGAVAFVLALEMMNEAVPGTDYWLATTLAVIFFTVFVLGGTTAPLLKFLQIKEEGPKLHSTEVTSAYTEVFYPFDRKYVAPIFVKLDHLDELVEDDGTENREDEIREALQAKMEATPAFPSHFHDGYHTEATATDIGRRRINTDASDYLPAEGGVGYQTT